MAEATGIKKSLKKTQSKKDSSMSAMVTLEEAQAHLAELISKLVPGSQKTRPNPNSSGTFTVSMNSTTSLIPLMGGLAT